MRIRTLCAGAAAGLAGLSLLAACDQSRQSADGSTQPGDTGTATAQTSGTVADTGSPEQGGANGTPSGKTAVNGMTTTTGQSPAPEPAMGATHPTKGP
jgi:hypothetical protein